MVFGKKKLTGEKLIDAVAGQFDQMVTDLTTGVSDCEKEIEAVEDQILMLQARESVLQASVTKAKNLATNLRNLMG